MKKLFLVSWILFISLFAYPQAENPFEKFGYDVLVASSSKGEFEEFHDQTEIVEIGSVLYNTSTKEIVKLLEKGETTLNLSSATAAMSIDPLCEKYYWISPYTYCLNNPIKFIDPDGKQIYVRDQNGDWHLFDPNKAYEGKDQYIQSVYDTYAYFKEKHNTDVFDNFIGDGSPDIRIRSRRDERAEFRGKKDFDKKKTNEFGTIFWQDRKASSFKDGEGNDSGHSPSMLLYHEFGHANLALDIGIENHNKLYWQDPDDKERYPNKQEEEVGIRYEDPAVKAVKQSLRNTYKIPLVPVPSIHHIPGKKTK